ncbi:MAG TPA: molybdopterin molybdotransferase MoeA [Spirochaetales bacterium]|nr:molybdopterin molybdotransferase MoeA [Spirochaetales bacterium]
MVRDIHPDEAIALVIATAVKVCPKPKTEKVGLDAALGRRLARSYFSPIDHPPFTKASMDGFAFSSQAQENAVNAGTPQGNVHRVTQIIAAGGPWPEPISGTDVARIMTGAPIPRGADAVQRIEWTEEAGKDAQGRPLVRFMRQETARNVIGQGENLKSGQLLLSPRVLMPQDIGILAAAGIAEPEVAVRPRVVVVSTGNEVVGVGEERTAAAIYDSNGPQLRAQAQAFGCLAEYWGIVPDDRGLLATTLSRALGAADIVLISGGVSMGDFDLVPAVLSDLGVEPVYHSIKMRPGKPSYLGVVGNTAVFALPGNPVSTFVNFEILVKPYIRVMTGAQEGEGSLVVPCRLKKALERTLCDRVEFWPAKLTIETHSASDAEISADSAKKEPTLCATPLEYGGSSMINILSEANVLLRMEIGQTELKSGEIVNARLIRA